MTEQTAAIPLTARERDLIHTLRAIPESAFKNRILDAVDGLARLGSEPRCSEAQADGVPCSCSRADCATCGRATERLTFLIDPDQFVV